MTTLRHIIQQELRDKLLEADSQMLIEMGNRDISPNYHWIDVTILLPHDKSTRLSNIFIYDDKISVQSYILSCFRASPAHTEFSIHRSDFIQQTIKTILCWKSSTLKYLK